MRRLSGIGMAIAASAIVDRVLASVVRDAPPRTASAWLAAIGAHALLVLAAVFLIVVLAAVARPFAAARRAAIVVGAVVVAIALPALVLTGEEITAGPWIAAQAWAPILRHGIALGGAAALGVAVGIVVATPPDRTAAAWIVTIAVTVCGVLAAFADVVVAPGRFPVAHRVALALASLAFTIAGLRIARSRASTGVPTRLLATVTAIAIVGGTIAFARMSAAVRAELLLHAPATATLLRLRGADSHRLLAVLAAPSTDDDDAPRADASRLALPDDASIVLVTIDALRADALPPVRDDDEHPVAPGDTPFLDDIVARSTTFIHAYAQASTTVASLPVMFRSIGVFEPPDKLGRPLAHVLSDQHLRPLAVVNDWFVTDKTPRVAALLDGFARVQIYAPAEGDRVVPMALELVDDVAPEPFFLWIHVFALHEPGYAGRVLGARDGDRNARYRRSLRWLDGELRALSDALTERGLGQRTVLVIASDHGEGLGDNGVTLHGATVFEEEVRVPLVMHIPGRAPSVVAATVGNVDVVPTLLELLGAPADPIHRGRSLVPLLLDPGAPWRRVYEMSNRTAGIVGLVDDRDKLVWDREAATAMRFDLRADPREDHNLFVGSDDDEYQLRRLFRRAPTLLAHELEDAETRAVLERRIDLIDASTTDDDLDLLLRLVRLDGSDDLHDRAAARFDAIADARVRLRICAHLFAHDRAAWSRRLVAWLRDADDPDALAAALAAQGQPPFATKWVAARVQSRAGTDLDAVVPWLRLAQRWRRLPRQAWADPIAAILRRAAAEERDDVAALALAAARRIRGMADDHPTAHALAEAIDPFIDHPNATLQLGAIRALARRGEPATERVAAVIADPRRAVHVRQAALRAIARRQGAAAIDRIEAAGADPRLLVDAINLLRDTGDPRAIAALQRLQRQHSSIDARTARRFQRAIAILQARSP